MSISRCTIQYTFNEVERIDACKIIQIQDGEMVMHPISNFGLKAVRYDMNTETGSAFTENARTINDFNLTDCRIWSSPYEIILRIHNNFNSHDSSKKAFLYGYIECNFLTSSNTLNLNIGNEEIKLEGLDKFDDLCFANISNNINTRIIKNSDQNPLDVQGDFVNIYREQPINEFEINGSDYSHSINKILDEKSIIRS